MSEFYSTDKELPLMDGEQRMSYRLNKEKDLIEAQLTTKDSRSEWFDAERVAEMVKTLSGGEHDLRG